jgi:hypothetical protein
MTLYSTKRISKQLTEEISAALKNVDAYGSVEIYVQDNKVTQITTRTIKKTNGIHASHNKNRNVSAI